MHPRATQDMIKMMISIIKLIIWYSGMQLPDMAIPWKNDQMKNFNIKKMRSSQLPFYRKCIFQLDTNFAKFGG